MNTKDLLFSFGFALLAIAITSTMDANGLSMYSALPLLPLFGLFWFLRRLRRREVGLTRGRGRDYALAIAYPVIVIGIATIISFAAGATNAAGTNWEKAALNFGLLTVSTIVVAIVTEEGFFRGALWASMKRAGMSDTLVIICTSLAFGLWHISFVTLAKGSVLPPAEAALFVTNAVVIGIVWGVIRAISGSIIVSSVSHGVWNGAAYVLFGVGSAVRHPALGVTATAIFGVEVGVVGLILNVLFAAALWWLWRTRPALI